MSPSGNRIAFVRAILTETQPGASMFDDVFLWILILPGMVLGAWAQSRVRSSYQRFSRVPLSSGLTGAEVARHILRARGIGHVRVEPVRGVLSDHYDPRGKVLRLSEGVYDTRSIAAAGIAAHEAGHAIQDADDYAPMEVRTAIVPVVKTGSSLGPIVFIAGLTLQSSLIMYVGALLFGASALFALITLPVEFDASRRALRLLEQTGIIRSDAEMSGTRTVLRAAAWTYVAAAVSALGAWAMYLLASRRR